MQTGAEFGRHQTYSLLTHDIAAPSHTEVLPWAQVQLALVFRQT
jgi:hypothetical protein